MSRTHRFVLFFLDFFHDDVDLCLIKLGYMIIELKKNLFGGLFDVGRI